MNEAGEIHFCEACAFSAGTLLSRIAELEAQVEQAYARRASGVVAKIATVTRIDEEPVTKREPNVARRLAAGCR